VSSDTHDDLVHLLQPRLIGAVEIPNRIVRTAHGTVLGGSQGMITDGLIAYHENAARGGCGLTILEIATVHKSSPGGLRANDDRIVDGYRRLMRRMRPLGTRVFQQLWHGGAQAKFYRGGPPWSASDVQPTPTGEIPVAMTQSQIAEIAACFAAAARRVWQGGLDGVELHFAHGYLVQQFLSPLSNRREDGYGGDLAQRMRFGLEIIEAVRGTVPPEFPVGVRLSPEAIAGGLTAHDNAIIAQALERTGMVDFIDISLGSYFDSEKLLGGMSEPPGYQLETSVPIARATNLPSIVSGRFTSLAEAEEVVASGWSQFVGMTRAHIADPAIMAKTLSRRATQVRPCIACNVCMASMNAGRIACTVNAGIGREDTRGDHLMEAARCPRSVLIVGGGPAGLEAARVAASRGHHVTLVEREPRVGGQLRIASRAPHRQRLGVLLDWFVAELRRLAVDVRTEFEATSEFLAERGADVIMIATGSLPRLDGVQWAAPGEAAVVTGTGRLVSSWDVLAHETMFSGRAVVVDDRGHYEAIAAAERLVEDGAHVTFVTRHSAFAPLVEAMLETAPALGRLRRTNRFTLATRHVLTRVDGDHVRIRPVDGGSSMDLPAELVVFVSANRALNNLAAAAPGVDAETFVIGDALAPRDLKSAIHSGNEASFGI
jgi:2,4-dienoyl-CoA reductase-like NADH-dependent reductase (Old Yellow Enzyme family)/thioredoxin reductase